MSQGEMQPWLIEALTTHRDPPTPTSSMSRHPSVAGDDPWSWVRENVEWDDVLLRNGWQPMSGGYWCRPGKNRRDGHSAQLHDDGRLAIWTGEIPNQIRDLGSPQSDGGISISLADFITAYEYGGDRQAFGRDIRLRFMPPPVPSVAAGRTEETDGEAQSSEDLIDTSWFTPVDLTGVLDGTEVQAAPTILQRTDGVGLFYPGTINGIHGESGLGKGWVAVTTCAEVIKAGEMVVYVDLEDTPTSITGRLQCIGLTREQIRAYLIYLRPQDRTSPVAVARLVQLVKDRGVSLVIIDSLGEAFGLDSINEDKDNEVGPWLRQVPRALADAGACVVIVDHVTKSVENPLYPKGSARKRAAVGGAAYLVEALSPMTKGKGGKLRLTTAKDRYGFHARGQVAAEMVFSASGMDDMLVMIYPVTGVDARTPQEKQDTAAAECAVAMIKIAKRKRSTFSKTDLVTGTAGWRSEIKVNAFNLLVENEHLTEVSKGKFKVS